MKRIAISLVSVICILQSKAVDYQTGIDLTLGGTEGTDYVVEQLYHDPLKWDRKVIWLLDTTTIALSHNARNKLANGTVIGIDGLDATPSSGDEGTIRYKVDRDYHRYDFWSAQDSAVAGLLPAYSSPFSLSSLVYDDGNPVVGSTGFNPAGTIVDGVGEDEYYYGHLGPDGNEWHTLEVGDDDSWAYAVGQPLAANDYQGASDGKLFLLVVDPETPTIKISHTGDAQWYTTEPKAHRVPVVREQTSYLLPRSGSISVELRNISSAANVFYRIVSDPEDGSTAYIDSGSTVATLSDSDFSTGTQYLQFYYNASNICTRTVVLDPPHPSLAESHGNFLWEDATGRADLISKITGGGNITTSFNRYRNDDYKNFQDTFDADGGLGARKQFAIFANAMVALVKGASASEFTEMGSGNTTPYSEYAVQMLTENVLCIDGIGMSLVPKNHDLPSQERHVIGYYDANQIHDIAFGYDIIAANFRSDQISGGMTPIEDFFIRDRMASWVLETAALLGDWGGLLEPGMWNGPRAMAALYIAMIMPTYDSPVYGVSGWDDVGTGRLNTPYPSNALTWKQIFQNETRGGNGYPNWDDNIGWQYRPATASFTDYVIDSTSKWTKNLAYYGEGLTGHHQQIYQNIVSMYDTGDDLSLTYQADIDAVNGELYGVYQGGQGPVYSQRHYLLNDRFPEIVAAHKTQAISEFGTNETMLKLVFFDPNATGESGGDPEPNLALRRDGSGAMLASIASTGGRMGLRLGQPFDVTAYGAPFVNTLPIYLDAEETGTPGGVFNMGSVNWDQSSGALHDSESLEIGAGSENYVVVRVPSTASFSFFCKFQADTTLAQTPEVVVMLDGNFVPQVYLRIQSDGDIEVLDPNAVPAMAGTTSDQPVSAGTENNFWVEGTMGSGANASLTVTHTTGSTAKGSADITVTAGEWANQIEFIMFRGNSGGTVKVDEMGFASGSGGINANL